jgi:hypothetical protein
MENNIINNPEPINRIEPVSTSDKNIFKTLFFIFLGLFLVTISSVITFLVTKNKVQVPTQNSQITQTSSPTQIISSISPTTAPNSTSDWKIYTDKTANFSFKHPSVITLNPTITKDSRSYPYMTVSVAKMSLVNDSQFSDIVDKSSLEKGLSLGDTTVKVIKINNNKNYARITTNLSQFEICDVQLTRIVTFYINDYKVNITYAYNSGKSLIPAKYLINDEKNCGNIEIWKDQEVFYSDISNGLVSNKTLQDWFSNLEKIIETINF